MNAYWRWWSDADMGRALVDVQHEIDASAAEHPRYTDDPLRRTALVCEEAGEAIQAALDLTRTRPKDEDSIVRITDVRLLRKRLYKELTHTASMALKAMAAMNAER